LPAVPFAVKALPPEATPATVLKVLELAAVLVMFDARTGVKVAKLVPVLKL
jgi:hypothetical protein